MASEFVEEYNQYLADENSAVETYDVAIGSSLTEASKSLMTSNRANHAARAEKLRTRVLALGGTPKESSGVWGPLANLNINSNETERDLIALMEQTEAEKLVNYESQRTIVIDEVLAFLEQELLPGQHVTHLALSSYLKELDAVKAK